MLSKNEAKYIQSLSQKKQRQTEGLFLVEGTKAMDEVLQENWPVQALYATTEWQPKQEPNCPVRTITAADMGKITQLKTPSPVLAVLPIPVPKRLPQPHEWVLALDGIQDPGNLGTLIRIADWFGIHHLVYSFQTADPFQPKTIQATMGSFVRVACHQLDLASFLAAHQAPVYGAVLDGNNVFDLPPVQPGVLLLGNEGNGIDPVLLPLLTHPLTIPRKGGAESLNVAVAGGILVSHLLKA
jgi:RNA methyltransferase, TrmH family